VIYIQIQNKLLDFDTDGDGNQKPEAIEERMSDKDFEEVVKSSDEDVTSPESEIESVKSAKVEDVYSDCQSDFAEEETGEQVKTISPLISYTEDEEEVKPIYEFDFSWIA
jgi:hypothetical protein